MICLQLFSLIFLVFTVGLDAIYGPCRDLSLGYWKDLTHANIYLVDESIANHFFPGGPGESLAFDKIWVPINCSYHRFTNETLQHLARKLVHRSSEDPSIRVDSGRLHLSFIGDSTTRGVFCSIARILGGSEIYGPVDNAVCGGPSVGYDYLTLVNTWVFVDFGDYIRMSFNFQKVFSQNNKYGRMDWVMEWCISQMNTFAVMFNTGAWSFDTDGRSHIHKPPGQEDCVAEDLKQTEEARSQPWINDTMHELSELSKKSRCQVVYRNNHYNRRFGINCADDKFLRFLDGTQFQTLDTRNISREGLSDDFAQLCDGLHFDRKKTHTVADHQTLYEFQRGKNMSLLGRLETQISQHFLNMIFFPYMHHLHDEITSNSMHARKLR